ncbi:MAG: hypothetical protein JNK48_16850 [Bryobacterales bacterium]|nr:hypothetical protein [Bryobacterales bacterium]
MSVWEQVISAIGVILLVVALRLAARSSGSPNWWTRGLSAHGSQLEAVDHLRLTPQHSIHAVRYRGRLFLIAAHSAGCALLCEQADSSPKAGGSALAQGDRP